MTNDDILDSCFHGCAWRAYLEVWQATGQFPPDSEATRRRAYQLYEQALAVKNGADRQTCDAFDNDPSVR